MVPYNHGMGDHNSGTSDRGTKVVVYIDTGVHQETLSTGGNIVDCRTPGGTAYIEDNFDDIIIVDDTSYVFPVYDVWEDWEDWFYVDVLEDYLITPQWLLKKISRKPIICGIIYLKMFLFYRRLMSSRSKFKHTRRK